MPVDSRPPPLTDADLRIRPAQAADLDGLMGLETAAFASDRLTRRRLRALAGSLSTILLVAGSAGALTGYVLVLTRRNSRAARLYSLAVAPAAAGQGIGSRLLAAAEVAARARGADEIRLEVRLDNGAAIKLYQSRGYRNVGRREDYYADGMAAVRYARDLRAHPAHVDKPGALGRAA
jgi:ribosomal protein S18 acetylase RimI-like enzyme